LNYPGNGGARPSPLPAPLPGVELWWCTLDATDEAIVELAGWLSQAEHARARRYARAEPARRYIAGRAALRWILARQLRTTPVGVEIVRGVRGRPVAPGGPDFNVSNTANVATIALCTTPGLRIGIDVEHGERDVNHSRLSRKFLTERERAEVAGLDDEARRRAFLRTWTCKEAMSKATGDALSAPMRHMAVALATLRLVDGPAPYRPEHWRLAAAEVPEPFIATVALWQRE